MRFAPQTITVSDNKGRCYPIDALVAFQEDGTPVGLAVHPVYDLGPGPLTPNFQEYTLTHVTSGDRLHRDPLPTEAMARRWLEWIAPLADWTQPSEVLHPLETVRLQVRVARVQAKWDEEEDRDLLFLDDLFPEQGSPLPAPSSFRLDALTALIEWMSYGMEFVQLPPEARPALQTVLALHGELAQQQRTDAREGGRP